MRALGITVLAFLCCAAPAAATPVLELHGKRVVKRQLRFAGPTELAQPPAQASPPPLGKRQAPPPKGRPTRDALDALLAQGQIDQPSYDARTATVKRALRAYRKLTGTRKTELAAVIANADSIAASGQLTAQRLEPVCLTLARNTEWWTNGTLLTSGKRVSFAGTQAIWQYYPGQGIELQMLANFARVNALWSSRKRDALRGLIDELIPLGTDRGGGAIAWEYFFRFGGGAPPWASSISQGTAVQSLGRSANLLGDPALNDVAARSLGLFEQPPPAGVRSETPDGAFYLIYTFAPGLLVLNAHLQAVIGLYDFTQLTADPRAQALYESGVAEARVAVPRYDTGKWSLYSLERESDLSYHELVTTFLGNLCKRNQEPVFCDTAARFESYLSVPPAVRQSTRRVRAGKPAQIGFSLDKISRVGMTVTDSRGRAVLSTSAVVGRGARYFTWRTPRKAGTYTLRLSAIDLAGNRAEPVEGPLRVLKAVRR
ncbi:MAG: hypothetical protein QOJ57_363 [Thermoleophilaceae bacterium]|nr:hypothetical protein [Thermoleophilaceae bacterium]